MLQSHDIAIPADISNVKRLHFLQFWGEGWVGEMTHKPLSKPDILLKEQEYQQKQGKK